MNSHPGSGDFNYLLKNLKAGTTYEFRAVGKATIGTTHSGVLQTFYGYTEQFTTEGKQTTSFGVPPGLGVNNQDDPWTWSDISGTCQDQNAINFGGSAPCNYSLDNGTDCFDENGDPISCADYYGSSDLSDSGAISDGVFGLPLNGIGAGAHPIPDAVVHYHEGVETVFARQIMNYSEQATSSMRNAQLP